MEEAADRDRDLAANFKQFAELTREIEFDRLARRCDLESFRGIIDDVIVRIELRREPADLVDINIERAARDPDIRDSVD